MSFKGNVQIDAYSGDDFTKISFNPDLERFGIKNLSEDILALFQKRVIDIAGVTNGIRVFLDEEEIQFDSKEPFKSYCQLYLANQGNV